MRRIRRAAQGVWEFIAGDDWLAAVGVVVALGLTALVSNTTAGWFVMPPVVALVLTVSVWRAARSRA
jgi:hypothetical protein